MKLNSVGDSIFETFFEHKPLNQSPSSSVESGKFAR